MDEVQRLSRLEPPAINRAKEILAFEATALAHGEEEATRAYLAAGRQFGFADPDNRIPTSSRVAQVAPEPDSTGDLPSIAVERNEVEKGIWVVELFVRAGLARSNSEARRLIRGGGAYLNTERVTDDQRQVGPNDFDTDEMKIRAGKKNVRRVLVK